jgi:hypothetical protein
MFEKWRNYHIANGTKIACVESSFRTWISKTLEFKGRDKQRSGSRYGGASRRSRNGVRPMLFAG